MIKRKLFISRFIPDRPLANPHSWEGNTGKAVPAIEGFDTWQEDNSGRVYIISISDRIDSYGREVISVYYKEVDHV